MLVARLPSLERGAAVGPIAVDRFERRCAISAATSGAAGTGGAPDSVGYEVGPLGCAGCGAARVPVLGRRRIGRRLRARLALRRRRAEVAALSAAGRLRSLAPAQAARCRAAAADRHRRGCGVPARRTLVAADLEGQLRAVGIADVDGLAVLDVDGGHPAAVDVHAVEAAVVDRDPAALVEPQHQVRAGDQRMGDADVGAEVAADDDVVACREVSGRPVVPNGQRGRGWSAHRDQLYR